MHAQAVRVDLPALPCPGDRVGEIVLLQEPEGHVPPAGAAVSTQVREQHVVAEGDRAKRVLFPLGRRAPFSVQKEEGGPPVRLARRCERRDELDRIEPTSGVPQLFHEGRRAGQRGEQLIAPVHRGPEPGRRNEPGGQSPRRDPRAGDEEGRARRNQGEETADRAAQRKEGGGKPATGCRARRGPSGLSSRRGRRPRPARGRTPGRRAGSAFPSSASG